MDQIIGAAQSHFFASDEWMSKMEHENLGLLHMHMVFDMVTAPIATDLAVNVPRYENGFLYPPDGPGIGCEFNEKMMEKLISPGQGPAVVEI